jgi:hypothetical protein
VSPRGLTLIAAVREKPNLMGTTHGPLPGWPAGTRRLILTWGDGPLPTATTLSSPHARANHSPGIPPRRRTYGHPAISGRLALPGVPGTAPEEGVDRVLRTVSDAGGAAGRPNGSRRRRPATGRSASCSRLHW